MADASSAVRLDWDTLIQQESSVTPQQLLATPLHAAARPPAILAAGQHIHSPDQDIPLNKLKFETDVDPRRVLSYMFNVTGFWKGCVPRCECSFFFYF